jgi:hypothetical protein
LAFEVLDALASQARSVEQKQAAGCRLGDDLVDRLTDREQAGRWALGVGSYRRRG